MYITQHIHYKYMCILYCVSKMRAGQMHRRLHVSDIYSERRQDELFHRLSFFSQLLPSILAEKT